MFYIYRITNLIDGKTVKEGSFQMKLRKRFQKHLKRETVKKDNK